MIQANNLRRRLESSLYTDLGTMMDGYARAAASAAWLGFDRKLDFTAESVELLDEIVVLVSESPEVDLDFEVQLWGSYFGEVLRRRYVGSWEMTQFPGSSSATPAIEVRGSRVFPLAKIHRRLTLGDEEDLRSYYLRVTERLGSPARVN